SIHLRPAGRAQLEHTGAQPVRRKDPALRAAPGIRRRLSALAGRCDHPAWQRSHLTQVNACFKHLFMSLVEPHATRERLLAAAAQLFAERGFRGATLREIAERAGANVASANYHFGSKHALYREVALSLFAAVERGFGARGLNPSDADLDGLDRAALEALLRSRIEFMLETLLATPNIPATLMLRELCDPTDVLPEIVDRFIAPMREVMERIVRRLAPELQPAETQRCIESIVGQIFFHRTHRPALLVLRGESTYPAEFTRDVARHISAFSLAALAGLTARARARG
ncbi:MAG: CerR family C-terminal domain-containing protein, partial [Myxococcales bacterium]|nr:CerR family C-terminal domain-containing protein [Myxococcales bacterium]